MIFFTGSYTQEGAPAANPTGKGIGCFQLDLETGNIELLHYTKQRNPSYMVISEDKKYLYAVEEMFESLHPEVFAYRIAGDGKLAFLNSQKLTGDYACHLASVQDRLIIANYMSGNALSYPILKDGSLAPVHQVIQHEGTGPDKHRQEAAHAHMIYPFKDDHMYVLDLTLDKAQAYGFDRETKNWLATPGSDIQIGKGAGARHMVMDELENYAFVLGELTGAVFVMEIHDGAYKRIQEISFLPENYEGEFGGAAIRLHPNGEFLYASCRGADTIAAFRIDPKSKILTLLAHKSTEGKTPRDFNIDPTGKWLITANQDSNSLVVFEIDQEKGTLSKTSAIAVETPVNICWLW